MTDKRPAPRYTKGQLLQFQAYRGRRDLLSALLEEGRSYTQREVDALIRAFMKRSEALWH